MDKQKWENYKTVMVPAGIILVVGIGVGFLIGKIVFRNYKYK